MVFLNIYNLVIIFTHFAANYGYPFQFTLPTKYQKQYFDSKSMVYFRF